MTAYLIIDTSTDRGIVAISQNGQIIKSAELFGGRNVPQVVHAMTQNVQLTAIIVGIGPGSYTGIRIALSFAKGYAFAQNIPLIPVSGLFGLTPESDGTFIAALDAKIGGVFCIEGRKLGPNVEWLSQPKCVSDHEFQSMIQKNEFLVVIERNWLDHKGFNVDCSVHTTAFRPEQLLQLGVQEFAEGKLRSPREVLPLYLRRTQAEIERVNLERINLERINLA